MSSSVPLWSAACQVPLSLEFSRQKRWSGQPFPSPRYLPEPGIKPGSPTLQADFVPSEPPQKPGITNTYTLFSVVIVMPESFNLIIVSSNPFIICAFVLFKQYVYILYPFIYENPQVLLMNLIIFMVNIQHFSCDFNIMAQSSGCLGESLKIHFYNCFFRISFELNKLKSRVKLIKGLYKVTFCILTIFVDWLPLKMYTQQRNQCMSCITKLINLSSNNHKALFLQKRKETQEGREGGRRMGERKRKKGSNTLINTVQMRGAGLLKAQKGPGKALKEAIPCPATP